MISFIKANSTILILLLLIFLTVDSFLLIGKFLKNLEAVPNIKISYDSIKSYCFSFYEDKHKLAIINLTLKNISTKPIDIISVKLIDGQKIYLASFPKIKDAYNENGLSLINEDAIKFIDINILSENLLKNNTLPAHDTITGYAAFENVEPIFDTKNFTVIIETPSKTFQSDVTINPLDDEYHITEHSEE